jgi:hypothetical protein
MASNEGPPQKIPEHLQERLDMLRQTQERAERLNNQPPKIIGRTIVPQPKGPEVHTNTTPHQPTTPSVIGEVPGDVPFQTVIEKKDEAEKIPRWEEWAQKHGRIIKYGTLLAGGTIFTVATIGAFYHFPHPEKPEDKKTEEK